MSCSIDTAVERIEPKPGNETQSRCCRATNLLAASPAITDRLGLPIEMGTFRAFASSKLSSRRERERERERKRGKITGVISEASLVDGAFKIDEFLIDHDGSGLADRIFVSLHSVMVIRSWRKGKFRLES